MLSKALLSLAGRVVGIAAMLAFPSAARAAEVTHAKTTEEHPAHEHAKAPKKAKRGARHAEKATDAKVSKRSKASEPTPEVTVEKTSSRPPRPSATPLPTISAATEKPLAEPAVETKREPREPRCEKKRSKDPIEVEHGVEPRRTPILFTAHEPPKAIKTGEVKAPCMHAPVGITRGSEERWLSLTTCDGNATPAAVESVSILVRPGSVARPHADATEKRGEDVAPGIKRIDPRLVERLQLVVDHFAKDDKAPPKIFVVSGYRPTSKGSFHAMGRAVDFRLDGVENTDLAAFCKTLPDTGCGYYPNSAFIHMDVRDAGSGHVAWIDASHAGNKPEYVASWPPPPADERDDAAAVKMLAKLDELQLLPATGDPTGTEDAKRAKTTTEEPAAKAEQAASIAKERSE